MSFGKTGGPNGNGYGGISADGRFVVFESDLLIVPHDTNGVIDVFVRGPLRWHARARSAAGWRVYL